MNVQRPTSNVQLSTKETRSDGSTYDLEERLLEFASRIIRLVETDELIRIFVTSIKTTEKRKLGLPSPRSMLDKRLRVQP